MLPSRSIQSQMLCAVSPSFRTTATGHVPVRVISPVISLTTNPIQLRYLNFFLDGLPAPSPLDPKEGGSAIRSAALPALRPLFLFFFPVHPHARVQVMLKSLYVLFLMYSNLLVFFPSPLSPSSFFQFPRTYRCGLNF